MSTRVGLAIVLALSACDAVESIAGGPAADAKADGRDIGHDIADQIDDEFAEHDELALAAQTGSILRALNDGEIAQAGIALTTLERTDAKNLAFGFVIAYTQANLQLAEVMRTYGVGFAPTQAEAMLVAQTTAGAELLRATPPAQMDRVFVELQTRMQATAQVMLDELEQENDSEPMGGYLEGFHDMTDDHLDRAEQIFDDLD